MMNQMMNQTMNQIMDMDQVMGQVMGQVTEHTYHSSVKTSTYHRAVELTPYVGHIFDEQEVRSEMTALELKMIEKENVQLFYDLFLNVKQIMVQPLLIWSLMMIVCVCALVITKQIERNLRTLKTNHVQGEILKNTVLSDLRNFEGSN
jgi:hypothetical protein